MAQLNALRLTHTGFTMIVKEKTGPNRYKLIMRQETGDVVDPVYTDGGTSSDAWKTRTQDEFIEDYKKAYPDSNLDETALRARYDEGYRLNPESGRLKDPTRKRSDSHGYPYQKARKEFMRQSLNDPNVPDFIKGWIKQERRRVGESGYWKSPKGYDVGHRTPGIDEASNFHWETSSMNRSRGGKYKR